MSKALRRTLLTAAICGMIGIGFDFAPATWANIALLLISARIWYVQAEA